MAAWQIALKRSARIWGQVRRTSHRNERQLPSRRFRERHRDQLCGFPEVLGGCCQVELVNPTKDVPVRSAPCHSADRHVLPGCNGLARKPLAGGP